MAKKTGGKSSKVVSVLLVMLMMFAAAGGGIYCAKLFTTPYSSDVVDEFDEDTLDSVVISKEKCNILILGTDKSGGLTDVMMLAQIDPQQDKVSVLSIPRDTRIKFNNQWIKINAAHSMGKKTKKAVENSIIAVKNLTGIPINHFVKVNFDAFKDTIDELGGVDFDVPQRMKYTDKYQDLYIDLQPGFQHLDGDKSEQLVRFRRYKNGDLDRIKVQQQFLHAIAEQKLQMKYIGKINKIYKIVAKNMETSMTPDNFVQAAKQVLSIGKDNIQTEMLPCTPQYIDNISYVIPNTAAIAKVRETMFCYDENGNEIIPEVTVGDDSAEDGAQNGAQGAEQ